MTIGAARVKTPFLVLPCLGFCTLHIRVFVGPSQIPIQPFVLPEKGCLNCMPSLTHTRALVVPLFVGPTCIFVCLSLVDLFFFALSPFILFFENFFSSKLPFYFYFDFSFAHCLSSPLPVLLAERHLDSLRPFLFFPFIIETFSTTSRRISRLQRPAAWKKATAHVSLHACRVKSQPCFPRTR